jgi:hypothetical protein
MDENSGCEWAWIKAEFVHDKDAGKRQTESMQRRTYGSGMNCACLRTLEASADKTGIIPV